MISIWPKANKQNSATHPLQTLTEKKPDPLIHKIPHFQLPSITPTANFQLRLRP